jgi:hypothetical protein
MCGEPSRSHVVSQCDRERTLLHQTTPTSYWRTRQKWVNLGPGLIAPWSVTPICLGHRKSDLLYQKEAAEREGQSVRRFVHEVAIAVHILKS